MEMRKTNSRLLPILLLLALLQPLNARVGLALSGGGARALAAVGVLKVMEEEGLAVDCVAGTSMGAVVGGLYAAGMNSADIGEAVSSLDLREVMVGDIPRNELYIGEKRWGERTNAQFYFDDDWTPRLPRGLRNGQHIMDALFAMAGDYSQIEDFDDLAIPFRAVATDLGSGRPVILKGPSLHEAMRASSSFPSLFMPFELDGRSLVDGGILMNLPVRPVREMGANVIIGVNTTSGLVSPQDLDNVIDVLSQSMTVAMNDNVSLAADSCALVLCPDLSAYDLFDFDHAADIIAAGEAVAREHLPELRALCAGAEGPRHPTETCAEHIAFRRICVVGNKSLSVAKVREYTGLRKDAPYTRAEVMDGVSRAYRSRLFKVIYPVIRHNGDDWELVLHVVEREKRWLGLNIRYDDPNGLVLGGSVELNNVVQKNSKFLVNVDVGGRQEFNFDYVKNFGNRWGAYFHAFPYVREDRLYIYNENHRRIRSVRSLENGFTLGLGLFAFDRATLEGYLFSFNTNIYQDVSEQEIDNSFRSAGLGAKLYYETLDDWMFPMRGGQLFVKFANAPDGTLSDAEYNRLNYRSQWLLPLRHRMSLRFMWEGGSYFQHEAVDYDPFYIGGMDSFLGYYDNEYSAPNYRITTLGLRLQPWRNLYVDLQGNVARYGNADYWDASQNDKWGAGLRLGYSTPFGPIRTGVGWATDREPVLYFSVGWVLDPFFLSRR